VNYHVENTDEVKQVWRQVGLASLSTQYLRLKYYCYLATTAAIVAGTATAAAYTEAKFHIWKDITTLYALRKIQKDFEKAGTTPILTTLRHSVY
jgi:hypothetical protein